MQAFFEKISKKFQRHCSRMELFPFGGGRSLGSAMGRRAEILCAAQGAWKEITGQAEETRRAH